MGVYGICMGSRSLSQPRIEIAWASRWGAYGAMCLGHVGLYMYNNGYGGPGEFVKGLDGAAFDPACAGTALLRRAV